MAGTHLLVRQITDKAAVVVRRQLALTERLQPAVMVEMEQPPQLAVHLQRMLEGAAGLPLMEEQMVRAAPAVVEQQDDRALQELPIQAAAAVVGNI
jgi:hypothetical protein